jgi:hypothetical protein
MERRFEDGKEEWKDRRIETWKDERWKSVRMEVCIHEEGMG